jgi:signal transduction histidine kinase
MQFPRRSSPLARRPGGGIVHPRSRSGVSPTDHLRESITELKSLARGLRPALLAERGLAVALQTLLRHVSVPTTLSVELPTRPDATVETAAYFVIAEALQNVSRHAPQARAAVTVRGHGERLVVTVSDDGPGGVDDRAGTGLRGLTDRVTATGGRLAVTSVPDVGTTITAELPLHSTAARPPATDDPGPLAPPPA